MVRAATRADTGVSLPYGGVGDMVTCVCVRARARACVCARAAGARENLDIVAFTARFADVVTADLHDGVPPLPLPPKSPSSPPEIITSMSFCSPPASSPIDLSSPLSSALSGDAQSGSGVVCRGREEGGGRNSSILDSSESPPPPPALSRVVVGVG